MSFFGERIKELRKEQNLTQKQLAETLTVSKATIGFWENDKIEPGNEMLKKLATFFNVSSDYLLGLTDNILEKPTPHQPPQLSRAQQQLMDDVRDLDDSDISYIRGVVYGYKATKKPGSKSRPG